MDPRRASGRCPTHRLPRVGGDGPNPCRFTRYGFPAPPRGRGWTPDARRHLAGEEGFPRVGGDGPVHVHQCVYSCPASPAWAGMDPRDQLHRQAATRLPLVGGDGPKRSRVEGDRPAAAAFSRQAACSAGVTRPATKAVRSATPHRGRGSGRGLPRPSADCSAAWNAGGSEGGRNTPLASRNVKRCVGWLSHLSVAQASPGGRPRTSLPGTAHNPSGRRATISSCTWDSAPRPRISPWPVPWQGHLPQ